MHKGPGNKAEKKPQTLAETLRSLLNKEALAEVIFWVVNVAVALKLSNVLQSLTVGALWFPEPWREAIVFISSLSFIATTIVISKVFETKKKPDSKKGFRSIKYRALLALVFLGAATYSVAHTKELRNKYIFDLPQTDQWWRAEYGKPESQAAEAKSGVARPLKAEDLHTPDFLSYEFQSCYFPYRDHDARMTNWGPRAQNDANMKGAVSPDTNDIRACIDFMLTIEPAGFIHDAETDSGLAIRDQVDYEFMRYHFFTILSLALAWGLLKEEQETILDAVLDLVRPKA